MGINCSKVPMRRAPWALLNKPAPAETGSLQDSSADSGQLSLHLVQSPYIQHFLSEIQAWTLDALDG